MQELNGEIRLTINTQSLSQLIFKPKINTGRSKSKKKLKKKEKKILRIVGRKLY